MSAPRAVNTTPFSIITCIFNYPLEKWIRFQYSFPSYFETHLKQKYLTERGTVATDKPQVQMQSIFVKCACCMTFYYLFFLNVMHVLFFFFQRIAVLNTTVHHL